MKRAISAVGAGALLLGLTIVWGPSATAQQSQEAVEPVSVYSLDGNAEDTIGDPALATDPGVLVGDPSFTEDRFGNPGSALACDGVDDHVETKEPSNKNPLTFSAWFRADDVSGQHAIVDSDSSGQYGHSLIIGYDDPADPNDTPADGSLSVQYHNGVWDTDVVIKQGEWTHVFVTYSGDKIRVYVGTDTTPAALVGERDYDTSVGFDGSDFRFCQHNAGDPKYFKGAIDDVEFYDGALTPDEIAEIDPPDPDPDATTTTVESTDTTEPGTDENCGRRCRAVPPNPDIPSNAHADVHIRTPDGLVYDFQFMGDFVLSRSTDDSFEVQARMSPWPANEEVSVNTGVVVKVGADTLELSVLPDVAFLLNGEATAIPTDTLDLPDGGTVTAREVTGDFRHDLYIESADGLTGARVQIRTRPFIDVGVATESDLVLEGVLGNIDGDAENDMTTADGEAIAQPATLDGLVAFGDSWRVETEKSLFAEPLAEGAEKSPSKLIALDDLPEGDQTEAEAACEAQGITDPLSLHTCAYDVAATGDEGFTESAVAQEEAVEALPESAPEVVVAVEGAAPPELPLAGETDTTAAADEDSSSNNTLLLVGLGVLGLVLLVLVVALVLRGRRDSGNGAAPPPGAGPAPGPGATG